MKIKLQDENVTGIRKTVEYEFTITPEPSDEVDADGKFSTEPITILVVYWIVDNESETDNGEDWYIVGADGKTTELTDKDEFFADRNLDADVISDEITDLISKCQ
jgi:hypothetical protein